MKKLLYIFLCAGLISLATACSDSNRSRLAVTADQINRELPMDLGNGVGLDSVTYDNGDNTICFHYSISEETQTINNLRGAHDAQRRFLRSYLSGQEGNEFAKMVVDADANITLEYTGRVSGDKVSLTFFNNEIKEIVENQKEEADERTQLANLIAISNDQCPIQIDGDDLVMTGVALGDTSLNFCYSFNPDVYDFASIDIEEFKDAMWEGLKEELTAPGNALQLSLMKKNNVGVEYFFYAYGAEPVTFSFASTEIQKL